jgi:hypothetical protein
MKIMKWTEAMKKNNLRRFGIALFTPILLLAIVRDIRGDSFTNTGSLSVGRGYHTATLLQNGTVLVAGGDTDVIYGNNYPTNSAEIYDPVSGAWTITGAMAVARYGHTATLLPNGKVLVADGVGVSNNFASLASAELFDPVSGLWSVTGTPNEARHGHTATLLTNGKVLIAGGGANTLGSAELYDPDTQTWTYTGTMNFPRGGQAAVLLPNGKVLVAGGTSTNSLSSAEVYDPVSGTWALTGSMSVARNGTTATLLGDGTVLLAGGGSNIDLGNAAALSSAEIYSYGTGTWGLVGSMSTARGDPVATLLTTGNVLVAGGIGSTGNYLASAELYNPLTKVWTTTAMMSVARNGGTATPLNDSSVLFAGGSDGVVYLSSAELYDYSPGTATVTLIADPTIGGVVTGGGTLNVGSQVQISATPNTGWTFTGWNDGSTQNPRTITVPSNEVAYAANFTTNTAVVTLILIGSPPNGGTVSGGGTFEIGTQDQISATANNGWTFAQWNDGNTQNPRTITVPSNDVAYVADFVTNTAVITLLAVPSDGGTVKGGGAIEIGSQVEISATPDTGWAFTGWNDGSTQNPRTITVPSGGGAYAASFAFVANTAVVTVIASPLSGGTASGGGTFEIGSQIQISAIANDGWAFTGWDDGNMQNSRTVTVQAAGAAYAASFTFVPTSASYSGLFYDTNGIAFQSSGFFSLTMTANGTFTAKLLMTGETYPFSGSFSGAGSASNSISISKTNRLSVLLGFDSGGRDILSGQINDGNWTAELVANRAVYSKTNLAPQEGKFTVLFPGSSNATEQPGGDGFGTLTVDHYGNLVFSGTLGDGSSVSQSTVTSGQGQWPFYVSLYSGKGSILGWLTFTNQPDSDIAGAPLWTKLPQPTAKFYPAGFTNQTETVGSSFQFTNGSSVLNFAVGELWLANGNLAQGFTNQFRLGFNNIVTSTNKMTLTISTSSGLFTGSVANPATKKTIPIYGAVLQKQNIGAGYFLGTNESGEVFLGPIP